MYSESSLISIIIFVFLTQTLAKYPHTITFKSPNLYPEGITYDASAQHFLLGSFHDRSIYSVSDAGVIKPVISDPNLPLNSTFLGLAVDRNRNRLLAAVHSAPPLPPFNALAGYDLRSGDRLFLAVFSGDISDKRSVANDVAIDQDGNAYVTNSAGNFVWKVTGDGEPSIFSRSPIFTSFPVDREAWYSYCGLNGIAYVSKGFLLVVQSNTGKMFKVNADDGTAKTVTLNEDLTAADGIVIRNDGVAVVVSSTKAWFVRSRDGWSGGVVFDETALDEAGFPTAVTEAREGRVYVLYGNVVEVMKGNSGREVFRIEEIRSEKESKEEKVWVYVLVGLGLAYFLFWRFQMKQLVQNVNKKTH